MDYCIFVLGYDLLHNLLNGLECDLAFDFCKSVYDDFLKSGYNTFNHSEYECLIRYITDNLESIKNKLED